MKKNVTIRFTAALVCCLTALVSQAQYEFRDSPTATSAGLGPYRQNFDALAGTNNYFYSNSTLPGVYARFMLNGAGGEYESYQRYPGSQARLGPDDGSEGPNSSSVASNGTAHGPAWYHFGTAGSSDRALGGIAGTSTLPGQGYVGIRLKNSSTKTIVNLEIEYAMEQWFNSRQALAANVTVDYQRSMSGISSVFSGTWTSIGALGVAAPSTATAIAPRNGNAATNRRLLHTILTGLNLQVGEEIMLRFGYTFNSSTNGNGLSIDDVVITPQTNVFYSASDGNKKLDLKNTWGVNLDGSGTCPADFTADNTTYYVCGNNAGKSRISNKWTVSGLNSKIIVGDGSAATTLYLAANDDFTGAVDVSANATLKLECPSNSMTLGALHSSSTVEYLNAGIATQSINGGSYGTLKLTGDGPRALAAPVLLATALSYPAAGTSPLSLNGYDLLLLKGAALTGPARTAALFLTNGRGSLRRTVSGDGVAVLFPVGTSATSYTPVTLSQTGAQAEDTYSVRVANSAYSSYDANADGVGTPLNYKNVKKTWFVEEEVPGNSNITMNLEWNTADAGTNFLNATAHLNHFTNGAWDNVAPVIGGATAGSTSGAFAVARSGISSFSPFGVSSRPDGTLPVELINFTAHRQNQIVTCVWATASEKNSRDFVLERSPNGQAFEALGKVAAAGNSTSLLTYVFADARPLPGATYYRLRQTDLDGTVAFSPVVMIAAGATSEAAGLPVVVPNPGTGHFTLLTAESEPLAGALVVRNMLGAEVLRRPAGTNCAATLPFDLSNMPMGVYFVQVDLPAGLRILRVVKN